MNYLDGPKAMAIEINSNCNRRCKFCPNGNYTRNPQFLEEEVFAKVVKELREIDFSGKFTFNMFNEPLLDPRLPRFIEHVRKNLEKSFIYLNTNGDFLDLNSWSILRRAGLNYAHVTQYGGQISENIQKIVRSLNEKEQDTICAHLFEENKAINRAGLIKTNKVTLLPLEMSCSRPFIQMNINYLGKAVICCNDYLGQVVTGDVRTENILDIWRGEVFEHYREMLQVKDRGGLDLCKNCDWENS